ncbi:MAG: hypothetical protein KBG15_16730, partial [Kofleriaceae bacterium]|nr:hypothetical protein [Kofleriaceae bacterium]
MITPAVADATPRHVPCPLCGGLIHPIASRCKHCRAAIGDHAVQQRSGATVLKTLPALAAMPQSLSLPSSAVTVGLPLPGAPPQPSTATASFDLAQADDRPWWQRWPMIVVAVAAVAIVVAIVLMVWPQHQRRGTNVVAPPAPFNMNTNPMPETPPTLPSAPSDPWSGTEPAVPSPTDPSAPVPGVDPGSGSTAQDNNPALPTPPNTIDPNAPAPATGNSDRDRFVSQLATSVCEQIAGCTNIDPSLTGVLCNAVVTLLNQAAPWSSCSFNASKAATCLKRVQTLSCDSQLN